MEKKLNDEQRGKLAERLISLQEHGPLMGQEYPKGLKRLKGKDLRDIYEIRIANDQLRVFLFFDEDNEEAILVHAVKKAGKGKKKVRAQYETAVKQRANWLQERSTP